MNNKVILFSHHQVNQLIIDRFNNIKQLNKNWDVIPIGFKEHVLLPNSLIINNELYPSNRDIQYHVPQNNIHWFECDLFLYDGYRQCPNYDSYFLYEYDTICNVSVDSFFNTDVDFFGNNIENPASEMWEWVKLYRKHNTHESYFKQLYSYGQSTCIYVKNEIIKKCFIEVITNKHLYNNMFCEVRGGTLINQFTPLKKGHENIQNYISWHKNLISVDETKNYFYHPIK